MACRRLTVDGGGGNHLLRGFSGWMRSVWFGDDERTENLWSLCGSCREEVLRISPMFEEDVRIFKKNII